MESNNNLVLISEHVQLRYKNYRKNGHSRDTAITLIREEYSCELHDDDDRIAVLIGLALALCERKELIEAVADETRTEIQRNKRYCSSNSNTYKYITGIEEKLNDPDVYGTESPYTQSSKYSLNWKIGDTFSHVLTYPAAEKLGIMGWLVLLHKIGDYIHADGSSRQLMCVSLCQPGDIPSTYDNLQKLGFIPVMQFGERFEYLTQIAIKSKGDEKSYDLTKIGCFVDSNYSLSERYKKENPLTAMPLFGRLKRNDLWPAYEDQICRLYKRYKSSNLLMGE